MGFIDLLKSKFTRHKYVPMLSGGRPVMRQGGGDVYSYDVVQQALGCIAKEVSKFKAAAPKALPDIEEE